MCVCLCVCQMDTRFLGSHEKENEGWWTKGTRGIWFKVIVNASAVYPLSSTACCHCCRCFMLWNCLNWMELNWIATLGTNKAIWIVNWSLSDDQYFLFICAHLRSLASNTFSTSCRMVGRYFRAATWRDTKHKKVQLDYGDKGMNIKEMGH